MTRSRAREGAPHSAPSVVVVDHHDSYTWNLVHLIAAVTGALPEVVEHDEVGVASLLDGRYSHVVLSPGPGNPDDIRDFAVGRDVLLRGDIPVLGVCLGMQGLVSAYGGTVGPVRPAHGEVAVVRHEGHPMFDTVPQSFDAVRYHSLAAIDVPDEVERTAWCDGGEGPVLMAVAHRRKPLWGVQFHPESVLTEHGAALLTNFLGLS